jgi:hypothetical protein
MPWDDDDDWVGEPPEVIAVAVFAAIVVLVLVLILR